MPADSDRGRCANCGEKAGPRYCPHCGQEVVGRQGPFIVVFREILDDVWSLDSRLVRSLRALARPGELSRLYVSGKRAPYLRPFRFYLLASVVLFSTVLTLRPPDASGIDIYIGGELVSAADTAPIPIGGLDDEAAPKVSRSLQFLSPGGLSVRLAGERIERLKALPRDEIVEMIFSGLRRMLPTTLVLFVPFLALGLKLLYIRGRADHTLYLEHLVFALHFQTALFLAVSLAWLARQIAGLAFLASAAVYAAALLAILFVYLPMALRRFYGQSRGWTALKTLAVLLVYSWLLGPAVDISVLVAIWKV